MKKIDRLEKEVTAKQDILEQVSSGKGTRMQAPLSSALLLKETQSISGTIF